MDENALKRFADAVSKLEVNQDELDGIRLGTNKNIWECGNLFVIEHQDGQFGIVDSEGHIIVPFGKYGWIDRFSHGLARVRTEGDPGRYRGKYMIVDLDPYREIQGEENIKKYIAEDRKQHPDKYAKWGIINEKGEEVLPLEYDDVWGFYGKDLDYTTVEKDGKSKRIAFEILNPELKKTAKTKLL